MYLITCLCFYIFFDVQLLPEDDQDRSKHVGVMTNCGYKKYNFNIGAFVDFFV